MYEIVMSGRFFPKTLSTGFPIFLPVRDVSSPYPEFGPPAAENDTKLCWLVGLVGGFGWWVCLLVGTY